MAERWSPAAARSTARCGAPAMRPAAKPPGRRLLHREPPACARRLSALRAGGAWGACLGQLLDYAVSSVAGPRAVCGLTNCPLLWMHCFCTEVPDPRKICGRTL
jgi:hypothetical protein